MNNNKIYKISYSIPISHYIIDGKQTEINSNMVKNYHVCAENYEKAQQKVKDEINKLDKIYDYYSTYIIDKEKPLRLFSSDINAYDVLEIINE